MENSDRPESGFTQARLPWIVTAAALLVFLVTLNHWVRSSSLPVLARVAGWDGTPAVSAPLHFLVTYPFRWLPGSVMPVALNALAAGFAALSLGWLARSVAILPYDRTREARQRERNEAGLLGIPLAWVGPVFAVLLCGLQLSFWENATAATGEMLDLLLFAFVVRALLEHRLAGDERWLSAMAFVYGLGVTNNYAMIAFFPCFVVALLWIRGFGCFERGFLLRMTGFGLAGLAGYLVLPSVAVVGGSGGDFGFWAYLRTVLANQKAALGAFPPYAALLIGLTSVLPVVLMGVRWPAAETDTSRAGVVAAGFITRFMHLVMLAAAVSVFFDPVWSARGLGFGYALLPFYWLAALAVGYYAGYLLLVARPPAGRAHFRVTPGMRVSGQALAGATLLAAVVGPAWLIYRNLPQIHANNGRKLVQLADQMVQSLPAQSAYVISDQPTDLLLLEAGLARRGAADAHVLLASRLMPFKIYQQALSRRYGARWPFGTAPGLRDNLDPATLAGWVRTLAASNACYYLHPSAGYYFESVEWIPSGMVFQLVPRPGDSLAPRVLPAEAIVGGEKYWESLLPLLGALPPVTDGAAMETRYVSATFARSLTGWGVALQRAGRPELARRWLEQALRLHPGNTAARVSLAFNDDLRAGTIKPIEAPLAVNLEGERRGWDQLILEDGPFDHPQLNYSLGLELVRGANFRQALAEFQRLRVLLPQEPRVQLWEATLEAMGYFAQGKTERAEQIALDLRRQHPRDDNVLETLTQIYLGTGRLTNALGTIEEQLAVDPANARALLNKAAVCIQLKDFAGAIPPLNTLITAQPENSAALLNRAIAHLQGGQLEAAAADYETLRKLLPEYHAVYFGLGEIAFRRKDPGAALQHFETYLRYGDSASEEYQSVVQRVRQLKGGG